MCFYPEKGHGSFGIELKQTHKQKLKVKSICTNFKKEGN